MKTTWIVFAIVATCLFGWQMYLTFRPSVPDHSKSVQQLIEKQKAFEDKEQKFLQQIYALGVQYNAAQKRLDSMATATKASEAKMLSYEKKLVDLKNNIPKTSYRDSSKISILNALPK